MNDNAVDVGALFTHLTRGDAPSTDQLPVSIRDHHTLAALAEECERRAIGETALALAAGERLVRIADELGSPALQARLRRAYGQALAYANRLDEALAMQTRARQIAEDHAPLEAARAGVAMLHALARLGRLHQALDIGTRAHAELLALGDPLLAARAGVNLGVVLRMLDRPRDAIQQFDEALPLFADSPLITAQIQSNRAEALLDLCNFAEAQRGFREALTAFDTAGATRAASIAEGNLADLLARQGRCGPALHHFERARRKLESAEARGDAARLWIEQAEVQFAAGLPAEALTTYQQAIPVLDEHGLAAESARARAGLAKALAMLGRTEEAAATADASSSSFLAMGQETSAARTDLTRAQILLMAGDPAGAVELSRRAMQCLHDRPADLALGHCIIASAALARKDARAALVETAAGLAMAERIELISLIPTLRHLRGRAFRSIGLEPEAARELENAAYELARLRGTFLQDRFRAASAASSAQVFSDAIASLLASGSSDKAFSLVQQAKSGSLLDLLSDDDAEQEHAEPFRPEIAALAGAYANLRGLVSRLQELGGGAAAERGAVTTRIIEAERDIEAAEARLLAEGQYRELLGRAAPLEEILGAVPAGWALVEFHHADAGLTLFLLAEGRLEAVPLGPVGPVAAAIEQLQFQTTRVAARLAAGLEAGKPDAMLEPLQALYTALLGPISDRLAMLQGLVVAPAGVLHAVPFAALHDGRQFAVERFALLQCPSSSVMTYLSQRARLPAGERPPLIVSCPDPLAPSIAEEAAHLASVLPGAEQLAGADARIDAVRASCDRRPLVHFAVHGAFTPGAPSASGLKLSDGWLTTRDAASLPLRNAVVTLSGCDTGRIAAAAGDELIGLYRSFLAAGSTAILGTLWPVHDQTNTKLLGEVYRRWYAEGTPGAARLAESLRETCRGAIGRGVHPALWSPYFVIGAPA